MSSQKPRIVPWLISQIDSQKYPGLAWINPERTQFCIPWKHGLRQDRCEEDVKIFEAWAITSGSYDPSKQNPNPAVWKRNFRSALNRKVDIKVIKDNSSDSSNPCKIYEISRGNSVESDTCSEDHNFGDGVSPSSDHLYPVNSQNSFNFSMFRQGSDLSENMMHLQLSQNGEDLYCSPNVPENAMDAVGPYNSSILEKVLFDVTASSPVNDSEENPVYQELSPYTPSNEQIEFHQTPVQQTLPDAISQFFPNNTFETHFEVNFFYRGTLVKSCPVTNTCGFCITARQQPSQENYLEDVSLPDPSIIPDKGVAREINKLLQSLNEGILVEVRDGKILGKRLGKCRSFWSMTETPETFEPNPIDKNDYSVLYTVQQFIPELIGFIEGTRRESPQYSIWICLGELWPDERSWQKKLIMVQVTPVTLQLLHTMSYSGGATSLRSSELNLQISDSLSFSSASDMLPYLKDLQEMMDI
ncbi:interferon regulatory factor 3 [Bombina bombina]|uniref:interferon regulatory factor 3 n=1 Tax=Bombina bombina TaxID=8345 RepID=UPI00235B1039|nr:interferon regulatory factor 3 [Bombina bombina]XP_053546821.1 interferon regulatory factor 3 [Bombina bombina]